MNQVGQTATDSYPEAVVTRCLEPTRTALDVVAPAS